MRSSTHLIKLYLCVYTIIRDLATTVGVSRSECIHAANERNKIICEKTPRKTRVVMPKVRGTPRGRVFNNIMYADLGVTLRTHLLRRALQCVFSILVFTPRYLCIYYLYMRKYMYIEWRGVHIVYNIKYIMIIYSTLLLRTICSLQTLYPNIHPILTLKLVGIRTYNIKC